MTYKPQLQLVHSIQRLACTKCGAEANASCNCGVPYDVAQIVERDAERREKARKKKQKQRSRPGDNGNMPTETEAEETYQETLFDQACLLLDSMVGATRQRFFAYLKEKYHVT
jgi:hypothetical protein